MEMDNTDKQTSTALAYATSAQPPALMPRDVEYIINNSLSGSHWEASGLAMINSPTQEQRGRLMHRLREIQKGNSHHDRKAKATLIYDMLLCYPVYKHETETIFRKGSKEESTRLKELVAKYVQELERIPTWAVAHVCAQIHVGTAPGISPSQRPTTILVVMACREAMQRYTTESGKIASVLAGHKWLPPISVDEARLVQAKLKTFGAELREDIQESYRTKELRAAVCIRMADFRTKAILAEYAAMGIDPVMCGDLPVSPSLVRQIQDRAHFAQDERGHGSTGREYGG